MKMRKFTKTITTLELNQKELSTIICFLNVILEHIQKEKYKDILAYEELCDILDLINEESFNKLVEKYAISIKVKN
jgi:hypothetical protein